MLRYSTFQKHDDSGDDYNVEDDDDMMMHGVYVKIMRRTYQYLTWLSQYDPPIFLDVSQVHCKVLRI